MGQESICILYGSPCYVICFVESIRWHKRSPRELKIKIEIERGLERHGVRMSEECMNYGHRHYVCPKPSFMQLWGTSTIMSRGFKLTSTQRNVVVPGQRINPLWNVNLLLKIGYHWARKLLTIMCLFFWRRWPSQSLFSFPLFLSHLCTPSPPRFTISPTFHYHFEQEGS